MKVHRFVLNKPQCVRLDPDLASGEVQAVDPAMPGGPDVISVKLWDTRGQPTPREEVEALALRNLCLMAKSAIGAADAEHLHYNVFTVDGAPHLLGIGCTFGPVASVLAPSHVDPSSTEERKLEVDEVAPVHG
jgi:hypothetical protein